MKVFLLQANTFDLKKVFQDLVFPENPPQVPLGLCYIAAVLEKNNHAVIIFDNYLYKKSVNYVLDEITAFKPDVVGFSVVCTNIKESLEVAEAIKAELPGTTIIFGGPHATISPEDMVKYPFIDFIIVGEGEETIIEVLEYLEGGHDPIEKCKGLFLRNKNDQVFFTGKRSPIPDLDVLPLPARHLLEMRKYPYPTIGLVDTAPVYTVCSSRGCVYKCSFCSCSVYWNRIFRGRSAKNVVDEIDTLIKEYGARGIYFNEDAFIIDRQRVLDICDELIYRNIKIEWVCESRVDNVEESLFEKMYEAGCRGVWCGVESGSQKVLDNIHKGYTVEQVIKAYMIFKEIGIKAGAGFMLGFPDETMDDVKMTLELAKEIDPDWTYFQPYIGYPKSELYNHIVENRMFTKEWFGIYQVKPDLLDVKDIPGIVAWMRSEYKKSKRRRMPFKKRVYLVIVDFIMLLSYRWKRLYVFLKNIKNVYIDRYLN